jgi:photosystem II stability/assembly factor-like uncharacterized protein
MRHPCEVNLWSAKPASTGVARVGRMLAAGLCATAASVVPQTPTPTLVPQVSGTASLLQAVSPVSEDIVWVSGHRGTYARTTNGGGTWVAEIVPGADSLQFRDVHAVSADVAYLLAAGPGDRSRIYKTADGGRTWVLQFRNRDSSAFFDCFDFWDADHGIAFSDAVDGAFVVIETGDGGRTWTRIPGERLPPADGSEGGFAASGTCLVTQGDGTAWIGTGAGTHARVLRTTDRGRTWTVAGTPVVQGTATSGIASLAFRDELNGLVLGGDLGKPDDFTDNVARTTDGGRSWTLAPRPPFPGGIYGSAVVPGAPTPAVIAAGPRGLAYSADWGQSWVLLSRENHWAVGFASNRAGWAVGPSGRITRISLR